MPTPSTTFDELMRRNELRLTGFRSHPFFRMIEDDTFTNPRKADVLLACMQRFSTNFQTLLFIRQGQCADPTFQRVFLHHLSEEIGHDALLAKRPNPSVIRDTLFEAILGWFNYQMLVVDNADRAALMHLVLETAGDHFHGLAAARLASLVSSPYFETHKELDAGHADLATELLRGHGVATYERLGSLIEMGWDMMEVVVERVRCLVLATS